MPKNKRQSKLQTILKPPKRYGMAQVQKPKYWILWSVMFSFLAIVGLWAVIALLLPSFEDRNQAMREDLPLFLSAPLPQSEKTSFKEGGDAPLELAQTLVAAPPFGHKNSFYHYLVDQRIPPTDAKLAAESLERLQFFGRTQRKISSFFVISHPLTVRIEVQSGLFERAILTATKIEKDLQTFWVPQLTIYDAKNIVYTYTLLPQKLSEQIIPDIWPEFVTKKLKYTLQDIQQHHIPSSSDTLLVLLKQVGAENQGEGIKTSLSYLSFSSSQTPKPKNFSVWRFKMGGFDDFLTREGLRMQVFSLQKPLKLMRISSPFGLRLHPILNMKLPHYGVDLSAPMGTPIYAAADGFVVKLSRWGGYGKHIMLQHAHKYETLYGHMRAFAKNIDEGSFVRQGQVIGYVGSTGVSTGPHLHYEVRFEGKAVEPLKVHIKERKQHLPSTYADLFTQERRTIASVLSRIKQLLE